MKRTQILYIWIQGWYIVGLGQYIDALRIEKLFSIDSEVFRMHRDSSGIDSELSFEQQMVLHALESAVLCLFPNPYTHLNLK